MTLLWRIQTSPDVTWEQADLFQRLAVITSEGRTSGRFVTIKRLIPRVGNVTEHAEGNFLGLAEGDGTADVVILSVPYELTTSYGQGTCDGPKATLQASSQVELYDPLLPEDLPCGFLLHTAQPWDGKGGSLEEQLSGITDYVSQHDSAFPVILGGEHGMLPAIMRSISKRMDLNDLTLIQIDAHADLRDELEGDADSHACAARRSLDLGVGKILQIGIRAFAREEAEFIAEDVRVESWLARDVLNPCGGEATWLNWLNTLSEIEGPVWLTLDIDSLDPSYVPTTGTPVPGGLAFWQVIETIETISSAPSAKWIGADINEIVPDPNQHVTEFTAAMLATKIVAAHLARRLEDES
ncbi:MAG: N(1)-aminopropylagmatine ureohydrolase [Marine Group II euryarchaeote MED-G33]|nr:MAG: N(1)-aminopropylagmatine ureohydrolase [Marine Group II euryarchaeote MED-G33]